MEIIQGLTEFLDRRSGQPIPKPPTVETAGGAMRVSEPRLLAALEGIWLELRKIRFGMELELGQELVDPEEPGV